MSETMFPEKGSKGDLSRRGFFTKTAACIAAGTLASSLKADAITKVKETDMGKVQREMRTMIIDVQVHIFRRVRIGQRWEEYPAERLISEMEVAGVDKAILISYEGKDILPDLEEYSIQIDVDKEFFRQAYLRHPDRFIWFTDHIDLAEEDYMQKVELDVRSGARGIKLFPAYRGYLPNDPRYDALYKRCADLGLPVIMAFERWNDPKLKACMKDYDEFLECFEPVARRFRDVDFLLTHWGCFNWGERHKVSSKPPFPGLESFMRLVNRHDNLYTDIAAITFVIGQANGEAWPYPTGLELLRELINGVGIEKVMWGTDWPWTDTSGITYKQCVTMIQDGATFLKEREKQMLLGDNAARFLGIAP